MSRKRPATKTEVVDNDKKRGLLIRSEHIYKFMDPVLQRKTAEIRNFHCRVMSTGSIFYLVESGLKDNNSRGVWRVWARVEFQGNTFVKHENLMDHFAKHRCTHAEYEAVRKGWGNDKGGFVMWNIKLLEVFANPTYIAARPGEERNGEGKLGECKSNNTLK